MIGFNRGGEPLGDVPGSCGKTREIYPCVGAQNSIHNKPFGSVWKDSRTVDGSSLSPLPSWPCSQAISFQTLSSNQFRKGCLKVWGPPCQQACLGAPALQLLLWALPWGTKECTVGAIKQEARANSREQKECRIQKLEADLQRDEDWAFGYWWELPMLAVRVEGCLLSYSMWVVIFPRLCCVSRLKIFLFTHSITRKLWLLFIFCGDKKCKHLSSFGGGQQKRQWS